MSEFTDLAVQSRSLFGDKVKQLRRSGFVPANIHGSGIESVAIQVETPNLIKLVSQVGESEIVTITIEGEKDTRPVLISEVQKDPVSYDVLHVDFRQVDLTKEVTVEAEIKLEGEPAILKTGKAILLELLDTLEVTALPNKLPSEIIVDVSGLENIGDAITVADLQLGEGITIEADPEQLICKIDEVVIREEEEEAEDAEEAAEGEAGAEETVAEEAESEEETPEE